MKIKYGKGRTPFGTGVDIKLSGSEVATAIAAYLTAHNVHINGARTVYVNDSLCCSGRVYVDPSGFVVDNGEKYDGRGPDNFDDDQPHAPPINPWERSKT